MRTKVVKHREVKETYLQAKKKTQASDVLRHATVSESSAPTGFNTVNLCDYDINLLRWKISPEEVDSKNFNQKAIVQRTYRFVCHLFECPYRLG